MSKVLERYLQKEKNPYNYENIRRNWLYGSYPYTILDLERMCNITSFPKKEEHLAHELMKKMKEQYLIVFDITSEYDEKENEIGPILSKDDPIIENIKRFEIILSKLIYLLQKFRNDIFYDAIYIDPDKEEKTLNQKSAM